MRILLFVSFVFLFSCEPKYAGKTDAEWQEYANSTGIPVSIPGKQFTPQKNKSNEDEEQSSNSSHNSNEINSDNKNDDPTLGIVGHKKWCDCAECDKIRDDNGMNGNAMGGSQHAWEESAKQEKSTGKIICQNCKGTGKAKSTCENCNGTGSRTVSGSDIDPACHGTGEIFGTCTVCKGKGRVAERE